MGNQSSNETEAPPNIIPNQIFNSLEKEETFYEVSLTSLDRCCSKSIDGFPKDKNFKKSNGEIPSSQPTKTGWRKFGGIIFGLSASLFFSLTTLTVKILSNFHPFGLSPCLFSGIVIPSLPILLYYQYRKKGRINVFETVWPFQEKEKRVVFLILMCRALLGSTSVFLRFYSLKYISIADSSVISHSSPVFVVIIAHFLLKEKCGIVSPFLAVLTCIGVFVIFRPPTITGSEEFDSDTLIGSLLASCAMLTNAFMFIVMRKLREVHFSLMLFSFGLWGLIESLIIGGALGKLQWPSDLHDSFLVLLVIPVLVFAGQYSIVLALKFENAGPVSLVRTCDVIFSFVWQYLFLNVVPDEYSLIGATIVTFGVVVISLRKWLSTLPEDEPYRNRFKWFLL